MHIITTRHPTSSEIHRLQRRRGCPGTPLALCAAAAEQRAGSARGAGDVLLRWPGDLGGGFIALSHRIHLIMVILCYFAILSSQNMKVLKSF